jgi:hypothetical protein
MWMVDEMQTFLRESGERFGPQIVLALLVASWFSAGLSFMTHMHHRGLQFVQWDKMPLYDEGYELLSDWTVIPAGVVGLVCIALLQVAKPRAVPRRLVLVSFALQVSVFILRLVMWGQWAEEIRAADSVFHPAYRLYMDWNWLRVTIIFACAILALFMAMALLRGRASHRLPSGDDP